MLTQFEKIAHVKSLFPINLGTIITHYRPSIDEIVAIADIIYHSEGKFIQPEDGIDLKFYGPNEIKELLAPYNGDSIALLIETGTLIVGMGGSFLDEHPHEHNGHQRVEKECAATLTSKLLGSNQDPLWRSIIRYAYQDDVGKRFDWHYLDASMTLPNLIKDAYTAKHDELSVLNDAIDYIIGYHESLESGKIILSDKPDWSLDKLTEILANDSATDALERFLQAREYCKRLGTRCLQLVADLEVFTTRDFKGRSIGVALAETDLENISKVAFKSRQDIHILAVRNSTKNAQIFTRNKWGIDLSNTIGILRQLENSAQGRPRLSSLDCYQAGTLSECNEWTLFTPANKCDMVFNGSLTTAKDVPATKLRNENIRVAIVEGIAKPPRRLSQENLKPATTGTLDLSNGDDVQSTDPTANSQYSTKLDASAQPLSANI